jgi:hypothetical protein
MNVEIEIANGKATGKMSMSGQERPIDVDLGGPLFADAAGAAHSIASLPLKEGYAATFRNLDLQKQKPKLLHLRIAGSEKVSVPAGTFDTYKVEVTSAEGGPENVTIWVAKDSRTPVKLSIALTQMGGAMLTAELVQ